MAKTRSLLEQIRGDDIQQEDNSLAGRVSKQSSSSPPSTTPSQTDNKETFEAKESAIKDIVGRMEKPAYMSKEEYEEERSRIRNDLRERLSGIRKKEAIVAAVQGLARMVAGIHGAGPLELDKFDLSGREQTERDVFNAELRALEGQYRQGQINYREYLSKKNQIEKEAAKFVDQQKLEQQRHGQRMKEIGQRDEVAERKTQDAIQAAKRKAAQKELSKQDATEISKREKLSSEATKALAKIQGVDDLDDLNKTEVALINRVLMMESPDFGMEIFDGDKKQLQEHLEQYIRDQSRRIESIRKQPAELGEGRPAPGTIIRRGDKTYEIVGYTAEGKPQVREVR